MHAERAGNIVLAYAVRHQKERRSAQRDTLFGLRRANRRRHCFPLLGGQWQRLRPGTRVPSLHPGLRIDHPLPLQERQTIGQIFAGRY